MSDQTETLDELMDRLRRPGPVEAAAVRGMADRMRAPKPLYLLNVDQPDPLAIVLQVRTGEDGVVMGQVLLPDWQELPAAYDGPHAIDVAIPLADAYASDYGYQAIAIDIESSQLWNDAWGHLHK